MIIVATMVEEPKEFWKGQRAGDLKKVAKVEMYAIFEVFAFCGIRRTKTDF